ncbi:MAG: hypothetical protein JO212_19010 [Acetobacteraceae bacterium]|nr:hypothetical protein [Acetobacteraceae bacterium]
MAEEAKRLKPRPETLRELFLKSGNICAFPDCNALMMDAEGDFIGLLCHIEAAEKGGQRFNPNMSNEQRRQASNLMLMCHKHHVKTNDVEKYPVSKLQQIKADHERRFSHPERAIRERLIDWTTVDQPSEVKSLARMNAVLDWGLSPSLLSESARDLNEYISRIRRIPLGLRRFIGAVADRAYRMIDTGVVKENSPREWQFEILISDLAGALHLSEYRIVKLAQQLDGYGVGGLDDADYNGRHRAVRINHLNEWPFWLDLAEFCHKAPESIEAFTEDMDFARLDD